MPEPRARLVKLDRDGYVSKELLLVSRANDLRMATNPLGWRILSAFATPRYPAEVARQLRLYRQKVYYYTRELTRLGLLRPVRREEVQGGLAQYYEAVAGAYGFELPGRTGERVTLGGMGPAVQRFWDPLVSSGTFTGTIVVGAPEPRGADRHAARDGHYAAHLGFYLGRHCHVPRDFAVRLDVDIRAEHLERQNLILVGGPITNVLSADINSHLPARFSEEHRWTAIVDGSAQHFTAPRHGLIAKISNPFSPTHTVIVLAGVAHVGTKAAILGATTFAEELLADYDGMTPWARVVSGLDLDADGKVDAVEAV